MGSGNFDILIFDLDGTLIESRMDIANSVNHARMALGYAPLDPALVATFIGDGIRLLMSRALNSQDPELIEKSIDIFRGHYWEHCMDNSFLYPGVRETLEQLSENRILAIASNKREDFTRKMVEGYNLDNLFATIIGGDSLPFKKPNRKVLEYILGIHGKTPGQGLMIGDSATDIAAGKNACVATVAVTYGIGNRQKMIDAEPDYIIDSFKDLMTKILNQD